ncbi:MAG: hypothetical protein EXR69_13265 [Myxococcales bacterium]|nr:hypothetical protein [Myxococcales bacterium]
MLALNPAHGATWELAYVRQQDTDYVLPSRATRADYSALVADLAAAAPGGSIPADASARALQLDLLLVQDGQAVFLFEPLEHLRGAGVVALRLGPLSEEVVLEAPHPLADIRTGAITGGLFDRGEIRAAVIATVHRRAGPDADPAASQTSWLGSATEGLARGLDDAMFVQLHGFDGSSTDADAVISAGTAQPGHEAYTLAVRHLALAIGESDVRTGEDVPALAATRNAQGRWLASRGLRFWHVELSEPVRSMLGGSEAARSTFADQLLLLAGREPGVARRRRLSRL